MDNPYPGVWEYPVLTLEDWKDEDDPEPAIPCSYLGGCEGYPNPEPRFVFDLIKKNFNRAYYGNRPPFGLHLQTAYFVGQHAWRLDGFIM